ncbi:MAG TPA: TIGR02453 family protein [Terriglobales bacterium]|nr:TIGR02453 family protein [Terriglobales bacterium]
MAAATYFHSESFEFLRQLKRNNRREWFTRNKSRYEEFQVQPALAFIRDFSPHLDKISPHFVADARPARGSLFRIYRDTRFSTNKEPYKTHVGIPFFTRSWGRRTCPSVLSSS